MRKRGERDERHARGIRKEDIRRETRSGLETKPERQRSGNWESDGEKLRGRERRK